MLRKTLFLSFLLVFTSSTSAEIIGDGPCPDITPVEDFDGQRFSGDWITFARTSSSADVPDSKCMRVYFDEPEDDEWRIIKMTVDASDNSEHEEEKSFRVEGPGRFLKESDGRNITVLATDYDSWSIIYTCLDEDNSRSETVHIFIRDFDVDVCNLETTVAKILEENDVYYFNEIALEDQNNCPTD